MGEPISRIMSVLGLENPTDDVLNILGRIHNTEMYSKNIYYMKKIESGKSIFTFFCSEYTFIITDRHILRFKINLRNHFSKWSSTIRNG